MCLAELLKAWFVFFSLRLNFIKLFRVIFHLQIKQNINKNMLHKDKAYFLGPITSYVIFLHCGITIKFILRLTN